jgi:hypothetical protein
MSTTITIDSSELRNIVALSVSQTLKELGIKARDISPWISQNQAAKLMGFKRLQTAMSRGLVEWKKPDMDNPRGRVYILRRDVEKLIAKPIL